MTPGQELLLDSHLVIWMAKEPERIAPKLQAALQGAKVKYVSHVTAWEIQIKHAKHPRFTFSLADLEKTMKAFSCRELPIDYADLRCLDHVRAPQSDPFDRLLIAQAMRRPVYLATLDSKIAEAYKESRAFSLLTDRAYARESGSVCR